MKRKEKKKKKKREKMSVERSPCRGSLLIQFDIGIFRPLDPKLSLKLDRFLPHKFGEGEIELLTLEKELHNQVST